jgi:benzoyl-CoA reductase subunit BamC
MVDALTYEDREVEVDEEEDQQEEVEVGLESLINKHGLDKVADIIAQLSKTSKR